MTFGLGDIDAHQRRNFGGVKCTCGAMGPRLHSQTCPMSLLKPATIPDGRGHPKKKSRRELKKLREPNATEAEYGYILEAKLRRGEILGYGFEALTLRAMDMQYTPDWHIVVDASSHIFVEIKGGWKWEDSIVKWKAFAKGKFFPWANFELWQKEAGQWQRLG